uniref:Pre-rRNA-processing protein TSR1 homolog n=1 Tax=Ornithodoros turicata TaxID=34597 RepID=A0A2R5LJ62_9ACAR
MALHGESQAHRAGAFKQQNKTHKHGRHKSNRSLETLNKGKVSLKVLSTKKNRQMRKQERRNQLQQIRRNKRQEASERKRTLGGCGVPPFLTAVIPVNCTADPKRLLDAVKSCDPEAIVTDSALGYCHISLPRFKKRFSFVVPKPGDLYSTLDAAKVADSVILLYSLPSGYDDVGNTTISALFAQGLPSPVHVVQGLDDIPVKQRSDAKKQLMKALQSRFPDDKVYTVDKQEDGIILLRHIADQKKREVFYRDARPHLLAEDIQFHPNGNEEYLGTLKLSGYIRGRTLSVNSLLHIPGYGNFQMSQIDSANDPHPLVARTRQNKEPKDMADDTEQEKVLERADPLRQQSLQTEIEPDAMDGEQTWPTPEELAAAEEEETREKKIVKKVPKGTSSYQACWIVDEKSDNEGDSEEDDVEEEDGFEAMDDEDSDAASTVAGDTDTVSVVEEERGNYDEKLDLEEEKATLVKFKEERMDQMFPDEVDTPMDAPARTRFARYRGLKSFHTSPWDPKENLPYDYARVVQFENFTRAKKRILAEENDGALPGWYVTIHVTDVPKRVYDESLQNGNPLIAFGMLPHEQMMSVLNVAVKRSGDYVQPIKSKERLVFHVAFRRFTACPIFSAHTNGDKHKYERFLRNDAVCVATLFAPVVFPPAPVLLFKEDAGGGIHFIGSGTVLNADPDRVVVKRAVLSGHPFKINRKSAVVRYMFFNRDDILWFRPVELKTKYGRRGHIKEPLGTHGHMKCVFNGQLKSEDTVLMHLYKRVFPKWTFDADAPRPAPKYAQEDKSTESMDS